VFQPSPTARPTFPAVETVHPVKVMLRNVPSGYRPSAEVRSSILRFVSQVLEESLGEAGLELIKVAYEGRLASKTNANRRTKNGLYDVVGIEPRSDSDGDARHLESNLRQRRRLESVSVPLRVTVSGPADISDFALSFIMENIRSKFPDLVAYLRTLDENANRDIFANVELSADTFNFDDILTGSTDPPSLAPTRRPTRSPTKVVDDSTEVVIMEETTKIDWWVWLIIILVLLLLCICCVFYCAGRKRNNTITGNKKQEQSINIWMKNEAVPGDSSDLESKLTRKSRRRGGPPPSISARSNNQSRRPSRSVRPSVKRAISQTELEEEALQEYEFRDTATEMSAGPIVPVDLENADIVSAISVDPPEENALVSYSHRRHFEHDQSQSTEPDGSKTPRKASMYASDVYYNSHSNTKAMHTDQDEKKEDPCGAKAPRQMSVMGEAHYSGPAISHNGKEPRGVKIPKKDSMFVCSIDELPEDVRSKSMSRAERNQAGDDGRKKKRKSKKKSSATDRLRSSLTRRSRPSGDDVPQDSVH